MPVTIGEVEVVDASPQPSDAAPSPPTSAPATTSPRQVLAAVRAAAQRAARVHAD